jgi:hypothetical protein
MIAPKSFVEGRLDRVVASGPQGRSIGDIVTGDQGV